MDEIDRALERDEVITPSTAFAARVMRAVREEASVPPPIEFPWARFLPGMLTSIALLFTMLTVLSWTGGISASSPGIARVVSQFVDSPTARATLVATAGIALSGVIAWLAVRTSMRDSRHSRLW